VIKLLESGGCDLKREAARGLINKYKDLISNSKIIGIGTGTTVSKAIEELKKAKLLDGKTLVPSSLDTAFKLKRLSNVKVTLPSVVSEIDVYIDGADEIDSRGNMIKGGGGALLGEKILASTSNFNIIIVDETKVVNKLGSKPLPIEVVPWALSSVLNKIKKLGFEISIRKPKEGKMGPVISDLGGIILDIKIGVREPEELVMIERMLKSIPGVVEVGLFLNMADVAIVGLKTCGYRVMNFERIK